MYREFACTKPSDCAAGFECFSSSGSVFLEQHRCARSKCSFTMVVDGPFLCSRVSDCPKVIVRQQDAALKELKLAGCQRRGDDPPGVKICRYR